MMSALHLLFEIARHVVAKIIKTKLVIGSVRDVTCVIFTLLSSVLTKPWNHQANTETQPLVNASHPFSMKACEIVIHRDHVNAIPRKTIQVRRKCRHKGLSFTGLHFCDPTKMQGGTTHQLHIEMTLTNDTERGFANNGERFHQDVVKGLAFG